MGWGYSRFPEYVSVAEKKARAAKKLQQLKKKRPDIKPVIISGALARSWWAKTWSKNLERYADYSNRLDRGKSYVRHGAVLDLQISDSKVTALVMGSAAKPYEVVVEIQSIKKNAWRELRFHCQDHLRSLQDLLAGKFPQPLAELFFSQGKGLFPGPKDIKFQCSCPDWASMCKHVAATLYGIGTRFDDDPSLFFTLRGVDTAELIATAVKGRTDALLNKPLQKSSRIIDDADLSDIFGIDMESKPDFAAIKAETNDRQPTAEEAPLPFPTKRKPKNQRVPATANGRVAALILATTKGITADELVAKTGYPKTKVFGIVHRLKGMGIIKNLTHGVYIKA